MKAYKLKETKKFIEDYEPGQLSEMIFRMFISIQVEQHSITGDHLFSLKLAHNLIKDLSIIDLDQVDFNPVIINLFESQSLETFEADFESIIVELHSSDEFMCLNLNERTEIMVLFSDIMKVLRELNNIYLQLNKVA